MRTRWKGDCVIGLDVGPSGRYAVGRAYGVPCPKPVTARCQLAKGDKLLPFWWLACDEHSHREGAGIIQHLSRRGYVMRIERRGPFRRPKPAELRALGTLEDIIRRSIDDAFLRDDHGHQRRRTRKATRR